jgi:hypothetical protein
MKAIQEHFAAINAAESELSMAVFEAIFDIKVNDAKSACAKEIADMILKKLNEINDTRKEIVKKYGF